MRPVRRTTVVMLESCAARSQALSGTRRDTVTNRKSAASATPFQNLSYFFVSEFRLATSTYLPAIAGVCNKLLVRIGFCDMRFGFRLAIFSFKKFIAVLSWSSLLGTLKSGITPTLLMSEPPGVRYLETVMCTAAPPGRRLIS